MGNVISSWWLSIGRSSAPSPKTTSASALMEACMNDDIVQAKICVGEYLASFVCEDVVGFMRRNVELEHYVDTMHSNGNAALHAAAFKGNLELVQFLVEQCGANVYLRNNLQCTALWLAAGYNHVEVLKYLLSREEEATILEEEQEETILKQRHMNSTGDSPLLAAASRGNLKACRILVQYYDDASLLKLENKSGDTPFSVALAGGHLLDCPELTKLLLTSTTTSDDSSTSTSCYLVNHANHQGLTPLAICTERDWDDMFQELVQNWGATLISTMNKDKNKDGNSLLHVAAFCGSKQVAKLLLGIDVDKDVLWLNGTNKLGCTPLWLAARTGNAEMVELLCKAGANPNLANYEGTTPLQVAQKYDKTQVVDLLQNLE